MERYWPGVGVVHLWEAHIQSLGRFLGSQEVAVDRSGFNHFGQFTSCALC